MEKIKNRGKILLICVTILLAVLTFSVAIFGFIENKNQSHRSESAETIIAYNRHHFYKSNRTGGNYNYYHITGYSGETPIYDANHKVLAHNVNSDYYYIYDWMGLFLYSYLVNTTSGVNESDVFLSNDIDYPSSEPFTPIGSEYAFNATFDGRGKYIAGLRTSLFSSVSEATIKNLELRNAQKTTTVGKNTNVGLLADYAYDCYVENCMISGSLTLTGHEGVTIHAGGMIGYSEFVDISNSVSKVDFNFSSLILSPSSCLYLGGIVGTVMGSGDIESSYYYGKFNCRDEGVEGFYHIGGINGFSNGLSVESCVVHITQYALPKSIEGRYYNIIAKSSSNSGNRYYLGSNNASSTFTISGASVVGADWYKG